MNIELKIKDFILAMIFAYLLLFAVIIPLATGWSEQSEMTAGLIFGVFSLIIGLPVMLATAILGYPVFKYVLGKLNYSYLMNILISCAIVAIIIAPFSAAVFVISLGQSHQQFGSALLVMGIPTLAVALLSGFIFWLRTK